MDFVDRPTNNATVREPYLTTAAVAGMTGYSPGTLRNFRSSGRGPGFFRTATGGVRYTRQAVIAFIEAHAVDTLDQPATQRRTAA